MDVPTAGLPDPKRREPLWDRVDRNRWLLAAYVAGFVALAVAVFDVFFVATVGCAAIAVFGRFNSWDQSLELPASPPALFGLLSAVFALVALSWAVFALTRSERWLVRRFGASLVPKGELLETKMALKDMAIACGMPVAPALYVIESTNVNAFVFSARRRRAIVGVTRGLVERLSPDEQRAVFANLVARLASGDTIVSTGVTALMWPLLAWRERGADAQNEAMDDEMLGLPRRQQGAEVIPFLFLFGVALVVLAELLAAGHRDKQLRVAGKADAEGMLLLKDPRAMLSALEKCVDYNNVVPLAGETFADLFYCWSGVSTNDEEDPEWRRVARLREVLGVEGWVGPAEVGPRTGLPPLPPRLDEG